MTRYFTNRSETVVALTPVEAETPQTIAMATASVNQASYTGTPGNDTYTGTGVADTISGGDGDDSLLGAAGHDVIYGDGGNDFIRGGTGNDTIYGGVGDDTIRYNIGDGNDVVDGGEGIDRVLSAIGLGASTFVNVEALEISENIFTASAAQFSSFSSIILTPYAYQLNLSGAGAVDFSTQLVVGIRLRASELGNHIIGGAYNDTLFGGSALDTLNGGGGDDYIYFEGSDFVDGGTGIDTLNAKVSLGDAVVSNVEILDVNGHPNNLIFSAKVAQYNSFQTFLDVYRLKIVDAGTVDFTGKSIIGLDIDASDAGNTLTGTAYNDTLYGSLTNADVLNGGEGDDSLCAFGGADTVNGGAGNDSIYYVGAEGGAEGDKDLIDGGGGIDTISASYNLGQAKISDVEVLKATGYSFSATIDQYNSFQTIAEFHSLTISDSGSIDFSGKTTEGLRLYASASGNTITGTVYGDFIEVSYGDSADVLNGGDGNDGLDGGRGNNTLNGGAGDDWLTYHGGTENTGSDVIDGDVGYDTVSAYGDLGETVLRNVEVLYVVNGYTSNFSATVAQYNSFQAFTGGLNFVIVDAGALNFYGKTAAGVELHASDLGNTLTATEYDDVLLGDAGGDVLVGNDGDDYMSGDIWAISGPSPGGGNDTLLGGGGDDQLRSSNGADLVDGGDGFDIVYLDVSGATASYYFDVSEFASGEGVTLPFGTIIRNIEYAQIAAGDGNDTLVSGNAFGSQLLGGGGADLIKGGDASYSASGGDGHDTIEGGGGRDWLGGGAGNDVISGMSDDDRVNGEDGNDTLTGGIGDDQIEGGRGADSVDGGEGADLLSASGEPADTSNDTLSGGEGADRLTSGGGNDLLNGGEGDDRVTSESGISVLDGGAGSDMAVITRAGATAAFNIDATLLLTADGGTLLDGTIIRNFEMLWLETGSGHDSLTGSLQNDTFISNSGNDTLIGGEGDDMLHGGDGDDRLYGGSGNDVIVTDHSYQGLDIAWGGAGHDSIFSYSFDTLYGGDGNDRLETRGDAFGEEGDDSLTGVYSSGTNPTPRLFGGAGNDTLKIETFVSGGGLMDGGEGDDLITGASGPDTLNGGEGNDSLAASWGLDIISGGAGDDLLTLGWDSSSSVDQFDGGEGFDTVRASQGEIYGVFTGFEAFDSFANSVSVTTQFLNGFVSVTGSKISLRNGGTVDLSANLSSVTITATGSAVDVRMGSGNDSLTGGAGGDTFYGGAGNDTIYEESGNGFVDGGDGDDYLAAESIYSTIGTDTLLGGVGNDYLVSQAKGDLLDGGTGNDVLEFSVNGNGAVAWTFDMSQAATEVGQTLRDGTIVRNIERINISGGSKNDTFIGGGAADRMNGWDGGDSLIGNGGDDYILGWNGLDRLEGGEGSDTLIGGNDADTIFGGLGDDVVVCDYSSADVIDGGEGIDVAEAASGLGGNRFTNVEILKISTSNFTASALQYNSFQSIEAGSMLTLLTAGTVDFTTKLSRGLILIDSGAAGGIIGSTYSDTISGFGGNDTLSGGSGNDSIDGGTGNDVLSGGGGDDTLLGGEGNDTYALDDISEIFTEALNEGTDTVQARFSFVLGMNFENLTLQGDGGYNATGNELANILTGNGAGNVLRGELGNDTINAGSGNDTVDGGAGNDVLKGEAGIDLVSYGTAAGAVTVSLALTTAQATGGSGSDQLAGFEDITGSFFNDRITGSSAGNVIDGGTGDDTLLGGLGDDTYYLDSAVDFVVENAGEGDDTVITFTSYTLTADVERLVLGGLGNLTGTGNAGGNALTGNIGNNVLDGAGGNDTLAGGLGDDTYKVDAAGDVVMELAGEGTDAVITSTSYALADNIERLVLDGSESISGTGNAGNNALTGNSGNNVLDGAAGNDTLTGGLGNDTYHVDSSGDVVVEAAGGGTDLVIASASFSLVGAVIEGLTLAGTAAINAVGNNLGNRLTGNDGANILDGGIGDDTLTGGLGDDTYLVGASGDVVVEAADQGTDTVRASLSWVLGAQVENLILLGSGAIDGTGNDLGNWLTGNAGVNLLAGGGGDDTYVVQTVGDQTAELNGGGWDVVRSGIGWTLAAEVEDLVLTGSDNADGTGNALNNRLTGNDGINILSGGAGKDEYVVQTVGDQVVELAGEGWDIIHASIDWTLSENVEALVLTGSEDLDGTGNDLGNSLMGNAGVNILTGGLGNDTYYIDQAGDKAVETAGQGKDLVISSISYSLYGQVVENLTLTGTADLNATGNSLGNTLTGNDGNNVLNGMAARDVLTGGLGADVFVFTAGSGKDRITDFNAVQNDMIDISAYTGGVVSDGRVSQAGGNVVITLDGDNIVTVLSATQADVLSHIVW